MLLVARHTALCTVALIGFASNLSAASDTATAPLATGGDVIAITSIGRIVLVFVFVALLAVAIVAVLKRWLPKYQDATGTVGDLRVLQRSSPGNGLHVYLLEVDGKTVLLAQSRSGLAITVVRTGQVQG